MEMERSSIRAYILLLFDVVWAGSAMVALWW